MHTVTSTVTTTKATARPQDCRTTRTHTGTRPQPQPQGVKKQWCTHRRPGSTARSNRTIRKHLQARTTIPIHDRHAPSGSNSSMRTLASATPWSFKFFCPMLSYTEMVMVECRAHGSMSGLLYITWGGGQRRLLSMHPIRYAYTQLGGFTVSA